MAGKGGGAWKVAYADFVTAMMAFFLVMWIVAQSDQAKEAIAQHFNDPFARESDDEGTAYQKPPKHPAPARSTDRPEHEKEAGGSHSVLLMTQGGERTGIGIVVHFADEAVQLDGEAQRRLAEIAALLIGKPQKIEVRGHSSRRPLTADSEFSDHWKLCYERCLSVMTELEKLGIPPERLRLSQAAGYEPLAAPDEQFPGGGFARVEVSLLNETIGTKLAQHGVTAKGGVKVKEVKHAHGEKSHAQERSSAVSSGHGDAGSAHAAQGGKKHGGDPHGKSPAAPAKGHGH
jgi:chemotaxis protein MotB